MSPRSTAEQAERTRDEIVRRASELASIGGLEALSFGQLAKEVQLSKAGVAGAFGSKEALQLSILGRAVEVFREQVWDPAAGVPAGRARLLALCDNWFRYLERCPFPGGCLITTASVEWDARSGPIREAVVAAQRRWLKVLSAEAEVAIRARELPRRLDPDQVAFEIAGIGWSLNQAIQLFGDASGPDRARRAVERTLSAR
jgi:AcrR family transcriptional regulator